jgi:hypothetical protein
MDGHWPRSRRRLARVLPCLVLLLVLPLAARAQQFQSWRVRVHATSCAALTDGQAADICRQTGPPVRMFVCVPTVDGEQCSGAEWHEFKFPILTGDITDATITQADIDDTATLAANPAFGSDSVWFATSGLIFEGATSDTNEGILAAANVTGDRTWLLPNESGTLCTTGTVCAGYQASDADLSTLASPTAWRVFYSDGSSVMQQLVLGASGTVLKSNGAAVAPSFQADSTGTGLGTDFTSSTNDLLINGAGATNGILVFGSTGNTNNERLSLDLETTADTAAFASPSGVTTVNFGTLVVTAASFASTASAVDGGALTLGEDTTIGTDTWQLTVGQTNLPAGTTTHTIDSSGKIPATALAPVTAIVSGTAPTVNAAGAIAEDTTGSQLLYGATGKVALTEVTKCTTIETPTSADDFLFFRANKAMTVVGIDCLVGAATSAQLTVNECNANGTSCTAVEAVMTCTTTNTTEASAIDAPAIEAGNWLRIDVGTVTGSVGQVAVCITMTETRL